MGQSRPSAAEQSLHDGIGLNDMTGKLLSQSTSRSSRPQTPREACVPSVGTCPASRRSCGQHLAGSILRAVKSPNVRNHFGEAIVANIAPNRKKKWLTANSRIVSVCRIESPFRFGTIGRAVDLLIEAAPCQHRGQAMSHGDVAACCVPNLASGRPVPIR